MAPWTPQQQQPSGLYAPMGWQPPEPMAPGPMPPTAPTGPEQSIWDELGLTPPMNYEDALAQAQLMGPDYYVEYDPNTGGYIPTRKPFGAGAQGPTTYQQPEGEGKTDPFGRTATWNVRTAQWDYPPNWGVDPATQQAGYAPPGMEPQWRPGEMDLQQQQGQLGLQKEQMLAALRTQPTSWLEYASLSGEEPVIQPWMLPLMPQEYESLEAGAPIPGWEAEGESLADMPELLRPSAQYLARMSPSSRQQYTGYRQARTGMTPSDIGWRQWTSAPPSGGFGLRSAR